MLNNKQKILEFLQGIKVITVHDPHDFKLLKDELNSMGLLDMLVRKKEQNNLMYWRELASINQRLGIYYGQSLIFECQPGKGITFSWDMKKAEEWWGKENIVRLF